VPTKTTGKSYQICGVITQVDDTTLDIMELPIRKWTQVGGCCHVARPAK
jgi:DNA topoisomerase-2